MRITTRGVRPEGGAWIIRWTVANDGDDPLRILRAVAPHSRFRADEQEVAADIPAAGEAEVSIPVHVHHSGDDVENASLILDVRSGGLDWRILAHLRVRTADGMPQPRTERIDVQQGGVTGS